MKRITLQARKRDTIYKKNGKMKKYQVKFAYKGAEKKYEYNKRMRFELRGLRLF